MEAEIKLKPAVNGVKRLQGCINDLISIQAFAAVWSGQEPSQIASTLLEVLVGILRLDFAYARVGASTDGSTIEAVRLPQGRTPVVQAQQVGRALAEWLRGEPPTRSLSVPNPFGEGKISIAPFRLGLQEEIGLVVAGSQRSDFPTQNEMLILRVAANQAAIALQEARRLSEQQRAAEVLEQRVAERTSQLTAINEELRTEIIERERTEQRLAMQYAITRVLAESDTIADAMPHLLQAIGESMAWAWGALWNVDRHAGVLRCESIWHASNMEAAEFDAISRETVGIPGPGLKGRVWQSAEPTWIDDVAQAPDFRRAPIAARLGLHGAIAFPILLRGKTIGIMEFFSRVVQQPDDAQLVTLSAIGSQIGQFVERKRLEEEQRKLASLVENSTDFIGIASPEGQVLYVNAAGQQMVGLDGDEHVRATKVPDYVVEEERQRIQQHVLPAVMRHGHGEGETRFRHFRTGAAIPMLHHIFCIKEPGSDRPIALATISRDITQRKLAEQALRKSQEQVRQHFMELQAIYRTAPVGLCSVATGLRLIRMNTQLAEMNGLPPGTYTGRTFREVMPGFADKLELICKQVMQIGMPVFDREIYGTSQAHPGEARIWRTSYSPVKGKNGKVLGVIVVIYDVTERKRAEEALRRSEERFRLLVAGVRDYAIFALDPLGHVISWNAGAEHIKGYRSEEILGRHFSCFYPPEALAVGKPERELRVAAAEGRFEDEGWCLRKDGSRFWANVVITALRDSQGELVGFSKITRDLTERKQAEEALHTAQVELAHVTRVLTLAELVASIAHEVNQPLTAIINNSNACVRWLARQSPDLEGVRAALADIIANGQRASDVIARIRAALQKAPTQTERLEINHIIEEVIALMYHEVQRYGVRLHTELASDLPAVLGDRVQLQQVLLNLVMNGSEAMSTVMERPRQLMIRTTWAGPEGVLVTVQDSGVGLDPQTLERIFDAFYTTKPTGMGMGLAISRTIIKAHGGRLWAERNPGPGATLQFILPRATENQDD